MAADDDGDDDPTFSFYFPPSPFSPPVSPKFGFEFIPQRIRKRRGQSSYLSRRVKSEEGMGALLLLLPSSLPFSSDANFVGGREGGKEKPSGKRARKGRGCLKVVTTLLKDTFLLCSKVWIPHPVVLSVLPQAGEGGKGEGGGEGEG